MKLSRRLIPAFAMLLVSAVLMSTASFAWFSMNSEVTATGMSVTATAESSLVIKADNEGVFSNVGTTNTEFASLEPVTSFDGKYFGKLASFIEVLRSGNAAATWGTYTPANAQTQTPASFTPGDFQSNNLELITLSDSTYATNGYVAVTEYQIKNMGYDAPVYVSAITAGATDGKLNTALRVSVQILNAQGTEVGLKIYNPNNGTLVEDEGAGKYTPAQGETAAKWELGGTPAYLGTNEAGYPADEDGILCTLTANTEYTVLIYVWIEGQDQACHSENVDVKDYTVEVKFKAGDPIIPEEEEEPADPEQGA